MFLAKKNCDRVYVEAAFQSPTSNELQWECLNVLYAGLCKTLVGREDRLRDYQPAQSIHNSKALWAQHMGRPAQKNIFRNA